MFEEMHQNRKQCSSGPKDLHRKGGVASLNPRNINFMQSFAIQTGIAAADNCQEKRLHFPNIIRQLWCKRSIMVKEPLVTFLPRVRLLIPKLLAKVFAHERMRIQLSRIMRIFLS